MNCPHCFDPERGYSTGEINQCGSLDCAYCDVAATRVALNAAMHALPPLTAADKYYHAYLLGMQARDAEALALTDMLRSMWGHAIELGETDYFDDPQFGKDEWSADCKAAADMLRKK